MKFSDIGYKPQWEISSRVGCFITTRKGGVSKGPYGTFNLGLHTQDNPEAVLENRRLLKETLGLPNEPFWLQQIHSSRIITPQEEDRTADGAVTQTPGDVLAVMTADCLPILGYSFETGKIGAFHGGWKGLAKGILEKAVQELGGAPQNQSFWIGPGIGPSVYQVGIEVYQAFCLADEAQKMNFILQDTQHWLCNLSLTARRLLEKAGVRDISIDPHTTEADKDLWFSYRRENPCGRMAALIWLNV